MATKVAINGLGRIGRALFKQILDVPGLEVVAVNDLIEAEDAAYLLRYDTVYGRFEHEIEADDGALVLGERRIPYSREKDPAKLPWADLGVEIVLEATGVFLKGEDLRRHLEAGAKHVLLSAPAKDDEVPTVVHGVNTPDGDVRFWSCASCTTNCITPVVEILDRRLGVEKALLTTVHAYTASQKLVDTASKRKRRGRAGAANLVPTSTGAAVAATKALPALEGRFDGVAIRAPLPAGSISDIVLLVGRKTDVDEVNAIFEEEADSDRYRGIVGATRDELVSSDIRRDARAAVVDLGMTRVVDGNLVKVMAWYDNEWGYASQMVREARRIAGV